MEQYRTLLEAFYDDNENSMALTRQSLYNYSIHDRDRIKAERVRDKWKGIVTVAIFLILLMATVMMWMKIINQRNIIRLHRALDLIDNLKHRPEDHRYEQSEDDLHHKETAAENRVTQKANDPESLKIKLLDELRNLSEHGKEIPVSSEILLSDAYAGVKAATKDGVHLTDDNPLWKELENAVNESSPEFVARLTILTEGRMSAEDLHIVLLIKSGFRPVEIQSLLLKSHGAIGSRKVSIGHRMTGIKMSIREVDAIIRLF